MASYFDRLRAELRGDTVGPEPTAKAKYAVTKTADEKRYTLGVLYVPDAVDADGEYADAETLQSACWDYVRKGYRGIRDTHTDVELGELVELISWPHEVVTKTILGDGKSYEMKLPAGTVYAGVVWSEEAWPLVKSGKLRGYSMGGKAVRMKEAATDKELPRMAEMLREAADG